MIAKHWVRYKGQWYKAGEEYGPTKKTEEVVETTIIEATAPIDEKAAPKNEAPQKRRGRPRKNP